MPKNTAAETITLTISHAEQILELLTICDDLVRTGTDQVRVDLARSLTACQNKPIPVNLFIDILGFTSHHLHSQLARAHHSEQTAPR